jgi:predicted nucleic acid-binding protein
MKRLTDFEMVYPTDSDMDWGMLQLSRFHFSHNVGVLDCLIAAPAHRLQLPLYTTNLKHFTPLLGALAVRPY